MQYLVNLKHFLSILKFYILRLKKCFVIWKWWTIDLERNEFHPVINDPKVIKARKSLAKKIKSGKSICNLVDNKQITIKKAGF